MAERPSKQARPRFQSLRWKNNALWSQRSNLCERLGGIDEDISSGAVVFGNPEKKGTAVAEFAHDGMSEMLTAHDNVRDTG